MEWMRVEDKMPEDRKDVLFYDIKHEEIELGYLSENLWYTAWVETATELADVTHWMPLPDKPRGDTE